MMPTAEVPPPQYLAAAVGPVEKHCGADELMHAAEHLMILGFGTAVARAVPGKCFFFRGLPDWDAPLGAYSYGDMEYALEYHQKALAIIGRLIVECRNRILTDLVRFRPPSAPRTGPPDLIWPTAFVVCSTFKF